MGRGLFNGIIRLFTYCTNSIEILLHLYLIFMSIAKLSFRLIKSNFIIMLLSKYNTNSVLKRTVSPTNFR